MIPILCVALGGALGSVTRYLTQTMLAPLLPGFPYGTMLVNVLGSFVVGLLVPIVDRWGELARPFLVVGVLGGLTTMSSYAAEVSMLLAEKRYTAAGVHWAGGAVVCIAACMLGVALVSRS
jgi:CrcB protein